MHVFVYDCYLWTSVNIIGITRILNPYIGTEKEMKKKVAEFAARLKHKRVTKQPVLNAKPKPKKKESEAGKGKENAVQTKKLFPLKT